MPIMVEFCTMASKMLAGSSETQEGHVISNFMHGTWLLWCQILAIGKRRIPHQPKGPPRSIACCIHNARQTGMPSRGGGGGGVCGVHATNMGVIQKVPPMPRSWHVNMAILNGAAAFHDGHWAQQETDCHDAHVIVCCVRIQARIHRHSVIHLPDWCWRRTQGLRLETQDILEHCN